MFENCRRRCFCVYNGMATFPTVRTLVGDQCYLRPSTTEDIAGSHNWLLQSDPSFLSATPNGVQSAAESAEGFKKLERSVMRQWFTAVKKQDHLPVGRFSYRVIHPLTDIAEIDFLVDPDFRRKGFGTEIMRLGCRYLYRAVAVHRLQTQVIALNQPAITLLEKSGFRREGTLRSSHFYNGRYHDVYVYGQLAFESGEAPDELPLPFSVGD